MKKIKCCSEGKFEIYVNGTPDIRGMPNDAFKALISSLEREIYKPREEEQKSDNARRNKEWIKRYQVLLKTLNML